MMARTLSRLATSAALLTLVGCATTAPPLYHWDAFPKLQYQALLREGASPEEHIRTLEAQADKASALNAALPPGFRAHLGMLHLAAGQPQRARDLWAQEKAAFPEASPFMDRLLQQLDGTEPTPKLGSPG